MRYSAESSCSAEQEWLMNKS